MANVSSSNGLEKRPKLRFPGFGEPWKEISLSTIFEKSTQKNSDGQITNVICNSAKLGLIPQREYFDKDIANSDNTNGYYIIQQNNFVYNPRKSADAPYGPISRYKYEDDGIVSPLYLCFHAKKEIKPLYYEWYFRSSAWHRYIYMSGDSGARHDRVSIKDTTFFAMPIKIPSEQEQSKIATFLEKINTRIEKQTVLVENLKKYKRGLLQAIFDDSTIDLFGEVEHSKFVKLSDIMNFQNGINADSSKYGYGKKYISVSDILKNDFITYERIVGLINIDDITLEKYSVTYGDVLFQRSSETREDAGRSNVYLDSVHTATFGGFVIRGKKKADYNPLYLKYALDSLSVRKQIMKCAAGAQHINVSQDDLSNVIVNLPGMKIQKDIADFISHLDSRINSISNQNIQYQTLRTALLQQLFI